MFCLDCIQLVNNGYDLNVSKINTNKVNDFTRYGLPSTNEKKNLSLNCHKNYENQDELYLYSKAQNKQNLTQLSSSYHAGVPLEHYRPYEKTYFEQNKLKLQHNQQQNEKIERKLSFNNQTTNINIDSQQLKAYKHENNSHTFYYGSCIEIPIHCESNEVKQNLPTKSNNSYLASTTPITTKNKINNTFVTSFPVYENQTSVQSNKKNSALPPPSKSTNLLLNVGPNSKENSSLLPSYKSRINNSQSMVFTRHPHNNISGRQTLKSSFDISIPNNDTLKNTSQLTNTYEIQTPSSDFTTINYDSTFSFLKNASFDSDYKNFLYTKEIPLTTTKIINNTDNNTINKFDTQGSHKETDINSNEVFIFNANTNLKK